MKTTKSSAPKKGTIGYAVAKLVKRYGHYPSGITILQMALEEATQARSTFADEKGGTAYLTQTPGYKAAVQSEQECYSRMGFFTYSEPLSVAKKYAKGRCFAIRFAKGMTQAEMEASINRTGADNCDWQPYNEATDTFIG